MGVIVGTVPVFASTEADKAQAMKVVEEAAEVFGAWQTWVDGGWRAGDRRALIGECAGKTVGVFLVSVSQLDAEHCGLNRVETAVEAPVDVMVAAV